jgi:hypothetical protein
MDDGHAAVTCPAVKRANVPLDGLDHTGVRVARVDTG